MQVKVLIICSVVGLAMSQRGHYAGNSRRIVGMNHQNTDAAATPQQNEVDPSQDSSNVRFETPAVAPTQTSSNVPAQPLESEVYPEYYNPNFQPQGFPQQGFPQQGFPQQGFPQQGFNGQGFQFPPFGFGSGFGR